MKKIIILTIAMIVTFVLGFVYVKDYAWKEYSFNGCGSNLPDYQYSIKLPGQWSVNKRSLSPELMEKNSVYYDLTKDKETFTISCTTQGVGGDVCDEQYRKIFKVGSQEGEACFGIVDGAWKMGVLNLPRNPKNNAAIAFWSENIELNLLNKIFSTFQIR